MFSKETVENKIPVAESLWMIVDLEKRTLSVCSAKVELVEEIEKVCKMDQLSIFIQIIKKCYERKENNLKLTSQIIALSFYIFTLFCARKKLSVSIGIGTPYDSLHAFQVLCDTIKSSNLMESNLFLLCYH